jgi:hypothetical protein
MMMIQILCSFFNYYYYFKKYINAVFLIIITYIVFLSFDKKLKSLEFVVIGKRTF